MPTEKWIILVSKVSKYLGDNRVGFQKFKFRKSLGTKYICVFFYRSNDALRFFGRYSILLVQAQESTCG